MGLTDGRAYLLAAALARVLIAVACVLEFGPALEEFQYELVGPATHVGSVSRVVVGSIGDAPPRNSATARRGQFVAHCITPEPTPDS